MKSENGKNTKTEWRKPRVHRKTDLNKPITWVATLSGIFFAVLLFWAEHSRANAGKMIHNDWLMLLLWLIPPCAFLFRGMHNDERKHNRWGRFAPSAVLIVATIVYVFSGAVKNPHFFYFGWVPHDGTDWLQSGMVRFVLITAMLLPFLTFRPGDCRNILFLVFIGGLALNFTGLLMGTKGAALYRDDHPSFIFRLFEFSRTYPHLENYNPFWNGGDVGMVCISSGTFAMGLPYWPLWRWVDTHLLYTPLVGLTYAIIVPLLTMLSTRAIGASWKAAFVSGILAMGICEQFFLWMLHFGTVGAVLASSFVLPIATVSYRIIVLGKTEARWLFLLGLSCFMLAQWPPGMIMAACLVPAFFFFAKLWTRRKIFALASVGIFIAVLLARQYLLILQNNSALLEYVMTSETSRSMASESTFSLMEGVKYLGISLIEGHPLILLLGLVGVWFVPYKRLKIWFVPSLLLLAAVTAWGPMLKPNLQLGRMIIPLFMLAVVPAAINIAGICKVKNNTAYLLKAFLLSFLILGVVNNYKHYANRGRFQYTVLGGETAMLAEWIKNNVPENGRVMFAGKTVHNFGGGHVAYLPIISGHEMMACDYYHFPPDTVEYNYPPAPIRKDEARLKAFFTNYNVACVVTYHDNWKEYFHNNPDLFVPAIKFGNSEIFTVNIKPSLFLKGSGKTMATFNKINVELNDDEEDVILKYNWADGLKTDDPVVIEPYPVDDLITLISVKTSGRRSFSIRY